jgi:hypothetical protein
MFAEIPPLRGRDDKSRYSTAVDIGKVYADLDVRCGG